MAPTYAIIFMHMLETKLVGMALYGPLVWWRFIDDVWSIWLHGLDRLLDFIEFLNNSHPTIKFTFEYSQVSVNFLDVITSLKDGTISTDLYIKPTDTHQYLHPESCHPGHTKRAIPYSQALRILQICSDRVSAQAHLQALGNHLIKRGHSSKKVFKQIHRAKRNFQRSPPLNTVDRESQITATQPIDAPPPIQPGNTPTQSDAVLAEDQIPTKTRRIPLVLTFHPGLPDVSAITRRFLPVLHQNPRMKLSCPEPPLIAFRRPKNLGNLLVRAKISTNTAAADKPLSCGPCLLKGPKRGPKCELCPLIPVQTHVTSTATKKTSRLKLKSPADCDSKFVVYLITCTVCRERNQYVGQTNSFRNRMNNHKSNIRTGKNNDLDCALLYEHFKLPDHSPQTLNFSILEQCPDRPKLLEAETKWIFTLKTAAPYGLNTNDGLN